MGDCSKFLCVSGIVILVIGIILTIALVVPSFETVESTEVGLDYDTTTMKLDETKVYESGRHFIGVSHNFILYQTDLQQMQFDNITCRSKDGLALNIDISFQYRLQITLEDLLYLAYTFPYGYEVDAYEKICRNVFRDVTSKYEVFEFVNNRTDIEQDLRNTAREALINYGANVENFQLTDIQYPANFQEAIAETQNAILQIETAKFKQSKAEQENQGLVQKAKTAKQVIVNQAQIDANNIKASANGIASGISERVKQLSESLKSVKNNAQLNPTNLVNYQWLQAINSLQKKLSYPIPIRISMPKDIRCLYDGSQC